VLAQPVSIRVSVDGTTVTAYDTDTRPLWRKDLHEDRPTAAADLDADAFSRIVGAGNAITALTATARALDARRREHAARDVHHRRPVPQARARSSPYGAIRGPMRARRG
jgi:hypothetical protein